MKKLLLVLMVVAMASFLLVGCLPGIVDDGDGDGDDDVIPPVEPVMTFAKEYTNVGGVTFIPCGDTVTVAFPSPVEADYVVYIAVKEWVPAAGSIPGYYTYVPQLAATPNAGRTVWTLKLTTLEEAGCQPICLVALVKHPCCPGEEVAQRIVTLDCTAPELDLFVKFTDCADICVTPDPCVPAVPGAYMEWTSRTTGLCATTDCCKDACSGVDGWSLVVDPDACLGPCVTETGTGCPVEGALECKCLTYDNPTTTTVNEGVHYVDFSFEDKVENAVESTWKLTFDTDSLVTFEVGSRTTAGVYVSGTEIFPTVGWYTVYNDCAVAE